VTKLKPFQWEGVLAIRRFGGRALLADEQGLGKTIQALKWIIKANLFPAIVVTPASMKYTWQTEASEHFNIRASVLSGNDPGRHRHAPAKITILNYDILDSWRATIVKWRPKCLIIDEAQFIKNPRALRTRASMRLSKRVSSVVALTGTPITNRPMEFWSILKCIKPDLFPSRTEFGWRYCRPRFTPWGWKYDGASRTKELHKILRNECMIRRLKRDVTPELPSKIRRAISFKLGRRSREIYEHADEDFISWLYSISPAKANRAKRSQALTKIGYLIRLAVKLKLKHTLRWIKDFFESNPGEKLVALTMHTFVIDALKDAFGSRCVVIDGRVTGPLREAAKRKFQTSPKVDLLAGNWRAAGVGLTLTAARYAVALDLPWTPGDLVQGEDRVHRIGQKRDVTVYYLAALNTIEEKLLRILRRKSKVLDAVLDGRRSSKDLDVFGELLRQFTDNSL